MLSFVFPGQGSQKVAMLSGLYQHYAIVRETFNEASDTLNDDLWQIINADEAKLNSTAYTQPILLAGSVALWRLWQDKKGTMPTLMAGHSLGEYTALCCAGAIGFADALKLVQMRGRLMQEAVPQGKGAMAAILGLDDQGIIDACQEASQGEVVTPANFNAPGQVVIAGLKNAVTRAIDTAKVMGAKRAVLLPVSVPSHCELMKAAADKLAALLNEMNITLPKISIIQNVDARVHTTVEAIRDALIAQLSHPVEWVKTVQALEAEKAHIIVECGPGKVLTGLNKRIGENIVCVSIEDEVGLEQALTVTREET